jgi:hypothetical protein
VDIAAAMAAATVVDSADIVAATAAVTEAIMDKKKPTACEELLSNWMGVLLNTVCIVL